MRKQELIKKIAEKSNVKLIDATCMIEAFMDIVVEAFENDEKIDIRGFGSFMKKTRKARKGRNILAGTTVNVPEKKILVFKMSPLFGNKK